MKHNTITHLHATPTVEPVSVKVKTLREISDTEEFVKAQEELNLPKIDKKNWSKYDNEDFNYCTSCVESTAEKIDNMMETAEDISFNKLQSVVGKEKLQELFPIYKWDRYSDSPLKMSDDYAVSYYRGVYENKPAYIVQHSAIEYVFTGEGKIATPEIDKSQLTDIWNKAQGKGEVDLTEEAMKYDSAEEFSMSQFEAPIESLLPTEGHTAGNTIGKRPSRKTDEPVTVNFNKDGKLEIEDGNHRYFEALQRGDKNIKVKFGQDSYALNFEGAKTNLTDIWNKANAQTGEQSLAEEAKKYKSAEEFAYLEDEYENKFY